MCDRRRATLGNGGRAAVQFLDLRRSHVPSPWLRWSPERLPWLQRVSSEGLDKAEHEPPDATAGEQPENFPSWCGHATPDDHTSGLLVLRGGQLAIRSGSNTAKTTLHHWAGASRRRANVHGR